MLFLELVLFYLIMCFIFRVNLERVNQDPEVPPVPLDLLDLDLVTAKCAHTSHTVFSHCLLFQRTVVTLFIYVLIDVF